jgi:hypothetical protein
MKRRLAAHAHGGGVDDGQRSGGGLAHALPVHRHQGRAKMVGQRARPFRRAVGHADLGRAVGDQRRHDCPGRPAGADDQSRAGTGGPAGRVLTQTGEKTVGIGVVGVPGAVVGEYERVGRADQPGGLAGGAGPGEGGFLVRDRHVGAAKPEQRQGLQAPRQPLGRHGERHVMPREAVASQPVAMQRGRAGVADRPADHACERGRAAHSATTPRPRRT